MKLNERHDPSRQQMNVLYEICDYTDATLRIKVHESVYSAPVYVIAGLVAETIREEIGCV